METDFQEKAALCALNRIFGFKPLIGIRLVEGLGGALPVFGLSDAQKDELLGPFSPYSALLTPKELESSALELERLAGEGRCFTGFTEEGYPELLRDCEDPPIGLYSCSSTAVTELFDKRPLIAIVGTRDMSVYGEEWCRHIVSWLACARVKPTIVSGLAYGVDITAHRSALEGGMPTIAVLPTGIDNIYPMRHHRDARRIAEAPLSALVTDYPPHTSPQAINFIRRNRIIAALSSATILVESRAKGGGMITARLCSSYGRELLVLPGRIDDPRSEGCNILLREKLATPITDAASLIEELGLGRASRMKKSDLMQEIRDRYSGQLAGEDVGKLETIAAAIRACRGITVEEIAARTGLPYRETATWAGILESDSFISIDLLQRCTIVIRIV